MLAEVDRQLVPIPINLDTVNKLYGLNSPRTSSRAGSPRAPNRSPRSRPRRMSSSRKWAGSSTRSSSAATPASNGARPSELDKSVTARVPTRTNRDDRYFGDEYQFMPKHGYTRMFERMLDHPNINIMVQTDYADVKDLVPHRRLIYHRADRRVLRLPLRQAALPLAALPARHARQGMAPAGRGRELPADPRLHPRHRVQAPDRAAAPEDGAHL